MSALTSDVRTVLKPQGKLLLRYVFLCPLSLTESLVSHCFFKGVNSKALLINNPHFHKTAYSCFLLTPILLSFLFVMQAFALLPSIIE